MDTTTILVIVNIAISTVSPIIMAVSKCISYMQTSSCEICGSKLHIEENTTAQIAAAQSNRNSTILPATTSSIEIKNK